MKPVADLRGGAGDARPPPPPGGQNFFIFMQFSVKIDKIIGWRPPGSWRPLLGEILDPPLETISDKWHSGSPIVQRGSVRMADNSCAHPVSTTLALSDIIW